MGLQINVIGLRRLGVSAAMALKNADKQIRCAGFDPEKEHQNSTKKLDVFDTVHSTLREVVESADILILAFPVDELETYLPQIAQYLQTNTVMVELSPIPTNSAQLIQAHFPPGTHFITVIPTLNPAYFDEQGNENAQAHADLFENGLLVIADGIGAHEAIINLVVDLGVVLGGTPYFADPLEITGVLASSYLLPQISAAALAMANFDQAGWLEGMRYAGREFLHYSSALASKADCNALNTSLTSQPDIVVGVIDHLVDALQLIKEEISNANLDGLSILFGRLAEEREAWLKQREKGIWDHSVASSLPTKKQALEHLLELGR